MTLIREDLRCKQIDYTYVCEHTNPIYHENTNLLCEIQIYVQNSNSKILCNNILNRDILNLIIPYG